MIRGQQSDKWLKLSYDRKVSPRAWRQTQARDRWVPTVPNSFGLPAGTSCPGMTSFCRSCYAGRAQNSAGVQALVEHNYRLLHAAKGVAAKAALLGEMFGRYDHEADRQQLDRSERIFRVHWDGDYDSEEYAEAMVIALSLVEVDAWCYTRSFVPALNVVPILATCSNLTTYLSVDAENARYAGPVLAEYPRVLVAACAEDYQHARPLIPEGRAKKAITCPENDMVKGLALVGDDGVGACASCRVCPDHRRDIMFATSHREDAGAVEVAPPTRRAGAKSRPSGAKSRRGARLPVSAPSRRTTAPSPLAVEQRPPIPGKPECANPACRNSVLTPGGPGRPPRYCERRCARLHALARRRVGHREDIPRDIIGPEIDVAAGQDPSPTGQIVVTDDVLDRISAEALADALT